MQWPNTFRICPVASSRPLQRMRTRPVSRRTRQVFGDRGLIDAQGVNDLVDGVFTVGEKEQDLPSTGSAMALKASEVVAALAMDESYAYMGICQARFVTKLRH